MSACPSCKASFKMTWLGFGGEPKGSTCALCDRFVCVSCIDRIVVRAGPQEGRDARVCHPCLKKVRRA